MSDSYEVQQTYLDFLKGLQVDAAQFSDSDDSSVEHDNETLISDTTIKSLFDTTIDSDEPKKLHIANEVHTFLISQEDDEKKKSAEKIFELLIDIRNKRKPKVENIKTESPGTYETLSQSQSQNWMNSSGQDKTTNANNENECNDDNISQESKIEYKEVLEKDTRINEYLREEIVKILNSVRITIRNGNYAIDLANKTITILNKLISLVDKTISIIKSNKLLTQSQIQEYAVFLIENIIIKDNSLHDLTKRYHSAHEIQLELNIQNMLLFFILDQIHDNKPNRTGLSVRETMSINSFMSDCYYDFKSTLQALPHDADDDELTEILEKILHKNIIKFQPEDDLLQQTLFWLMSKEKITLKHNENEKVVVDDSLTRTFAIDNASTIQNPVLDNYRYASPSVILDAGSVISKAKNFFIGRPNIIYRLKDGYSFYRTDIYKIENDTIFIEMYMSIFFDNQEICTSSHKLKYMEKKSGTDIWVFSGASISLCDAFPKWIEITQKKDTGPLQNILDSVILKMIGDANFYMFDRLGPNMSGYLDVNKTTVFNSWLVTNCSSDDDNDDNLSIINNQQAWSNTPRTIFLNDRPAAIIGLIFSLYPNSNFMQKLKCSGEIIFENNFVYTAMNFQEKINRLIQEKNEKNKKKENILPWSSPSPLKGDSAQDTPSSNPNNLFGNPVNISRLPSPLIGDSAQVTLSSNPNNLFGNPVNTSILPSPLIGDSAQHTLSSNPNNLFGNLSVNISIPNKRVKKEKGGSKKKKILKRKIGKSKKKLIQIKKNKTIKSKKKIIKKNFITIKFRKKRKY